MHDNLDEIFQQPQALRDAAKYYASAQGAQQLDACARRLTSGRPVAVIGMGSSLYAGRLLADALRSHGLPCLCMLAEEALACVAVLSGFTTVLLSQSGESGEMVALIRLLPRCAEQSLAITNTMTSTLALACPGATLPMHAGEELYSATKTFTNTLLIAALLGARATGRGLPAGAIEATASGMDRALALALPALHAAKSGQPIVCDGSAFSRVITADPPAFVVGCDLPGEVLAQQAGLVFKEVARANVEGHSLGTFRHGPQETLAVRHPRPRIAFIARTFDTPVMRYIESAAGHGAETIRLDASMLAQTGIAMPDEAGDCGFAVLGALVAELWIVHTSYRNGYRPGHFLVGGKITTGMGGQVSAIRIHRTRTPAT
jgi:fructoselysine-6-P-deglycase FrlB-like protein